MKGGSNIEQGHDPEKRGTSVMHKAADGTGEQDGKASRNVREACLYQGVQPMLGGKIASSLALAAYDWKIPSAEFIGHRQGPTQSNGMREYYSPCNGACLCKRVLYEAFRTRERNKGAAE